MYLTSKKKAHRLIFTMIFCLLAFAVLAYLGFLLWEVIEFPFAMRESFLLSLFGGLMVFAFGGLSLGLAEGFGFGLATSIAIAFDLGCFGALALYLIHGQSFNDDQWDRLGVDETADRLIALLEDPDLFVRQRAIVALGEGRYQKARAALLRSLRTEVYFLTRRAAQTALERLGASPTPTASAAR